MDINYDQFNGDALIFKYNIDEHGNPISIKVDKEEKQVSIHGTIQLEFVPDEYNRVVILNEDNSQMVEVFNRDEIKSNTYYIDYNNGIAYLDKAQFGKVKVYNYYKKGLQLIGCSRIYDEHDVTGKNVMMTLQEIIDAGKECIRILLDIGDAYQIITRLEKNIEIGSELHNTLNNDIEIGTLLQQKLHADIVEATKWKDQLHTDVQEGKKLQPLLEQTVNDGNTTKQQLEQSIADAQDDIAKIEATGNEIVNITSSQWVYNDISKMYEKQITHTCNSENIHITCKTSDTKEALFLPWKIVDKSNILLKSDEAIGVSVVISARYYKPLIDNTTTQEVIDARKGKTSLLEKIDSIDEQIKTNEQTTNLKLDKIDFDYNKILNKPHIIFNNYYKSDSIYELDKMKLLDTTWSYYDGNTHPQFYPSVGMKENGEIYFQGLARIDDSTGQALEGNMVKFTKLYHFNIENFEGVPMWGSFIGINEDDVNDTISIPFQLKPNGDILIKNLGQGNKYYKRIDLNGAKVQTSSFGSEKVLKHVRSVEENVLNRKNIDTTLLFFTDIHHKMYGENSYRRYEQYKYINLLNQEMDIVCNISGGDNIEESSSRVKAIKTIQDFLIQFDKDKLVYCNGNHDHNTQYGNNIFIHPNHIKPYINNSLTVYAGENKYYGFTDYVDRKLRVITLDTHEATFENDNINVGSISLEQIEWIKNNALLNCPSDYNIIVVSHIPPTEKIYDDDTMIDHREILRATFESFKNGTGEFINQGQRKLVCWLSGHEHKDKMVTINGITYISNLLSSSQEVNYTPQNGGVYTSYSREFGTEYEFCFDIISIDSLNRKVYFDRVGKIGNTIGRTREISF